MREIRVCSIQPLGQAHLDVFGGELDREDGRRKIEENLDMACRLLRQAGQAGCDIVCYPEDIQGIAHYGYYLDDPSLFAGFVEAIPGRVTERVSAVAREHSMHVVFGTFEWVEQKLYNTAVLVGRRGEIVGRYHKVHLPAVERWSEAHGDSFPVFETDFGTVGMLICYDLLFPEAARALVLNGAEILFNPTMSYTVAGQSEDNGLVRVRARAMDSFVPLVVSLCSSGSVIVDSDGTVLAQARPSHEEVIRARMDLDATPMDHSQWEILTGTADLKARFLQERLPEAYAGLVSPSPTVLRRYQAKGKRLISSQEDIRAAYEEIRRRWSHTR